MGESGKKTFSILLGFLAALLLFCVILLFVRNILKRFGKISASGRSDSARLRSKTVSQGNCGCAGAACLEPIFLMDFTIS